MNLREALAYARDNYHAMIYSDLCILGVVYAPTLMSADFHIMEVAIDKDLRIHGFDYYPRVLNINIPPACKMGDLVANQVFGL